MMKLLIAVLVLCLAFAAPVIGQSKAITTIILLRHAEKQLTDSDDPDLSIVGRQRSEKLTTMFPNAQPSAFYTTPYKRTCQTLEPWARSLNLPITNYNPKEPLALVEKLTAKKGKTMVVSGHSNTIPPLVNLLLGIDKYQNLDDDEYNKIFVVTIEKGKAKCTVVSF